MHDLDENCQANTGGNGFENCECIDDNELPVNENGLVSRIDELCNLQEYPADFGAGSC